MGGAAAVALAGRARADLAAGCLRSGWEVRALCGGVDWRAGEAGAAGVGTKHAWGAAPVFSAREGGRPRAAPRAGVLGLPCHVAEETRVWDGGLQTTPPSGWRPERGGVAKKT